MGAVKLMQYMLIFHTCLHSRKASETDCSCNPACLSFDEYKFKIQDVQASVLSGSIPFFAWVAGRVRTHIVHYQCPQFWRRKPTKICSVPKRRKRE